MIYKWIATISFLIAALLLSSNIDESRIGFVIFFMGIQYLHSTSGLKRGTILCSLTMSCFYSQTCMELNNGSSRVNLILCIRICNSYSIIITMEQ